ncbi:outer membrane beta-barrel protein [Roseivirga sp.]|uniref:outer membrane beta-barrel protein n=1 Tax=Roseivirga sp. TaxID=1964215 RepID=UPI003B8D9F24
MSFAFTAKGQKYSISAEVIDSTYKEPLFLANVALRNAKDSLLKATVTDEKGRFLLENVANGTYKLNISFVGFKLFQQQITIKDAPLKLGLITLAEDPTNLDSVSVVAEAEAVILKKDTVEFNASAFKTTDEASLEDLIKKLPGMEVEEGKVKTQGKEITKIIVDGKPFFEGSPDMALKNIPADMVKKVQIIDEKSEETQFTGHDDGVRTKIINVVTKPEKKKGYFGRSGLTYSHPDRYNLNGNINFLKGNNRFSVSGGYNNLGGGAGGSREVMMISNGVAIPQNIGGGGNGGISENKSLSTYYYSEINKKLEVTLSYRYSDSQTESFRDISRQFIQASDEGRIYNEKSENSSNGNNHSGSIKVTYKPTKNDEIRITQSLSQRTSNNTSSLEGETLLTDELLNSTDNFNFSESLNNSWSNNLSWRHKFKKKGRTLSISAANSVSNSAGTDTVRSTNIFTSGDVENQIFNQISDPDGKTKSNRATISYTEPLAEKSSLRVSYTGSRNINDRQRLLLDFNESDQDYTDLDPLRSSDFELTNTSHRVYAGVGFKIKEINFSANTTYQSQIIENSQVYPNNVNTRNTFNGHLPSLTLRKSTKDGKQSSISFRRSMRAPSANQLQDVIDNRNPLFIRQGNPNLNASFSNGITIGHYSYNEKSLSFLQISGSVTFTENSIVNRTIVGNGSNSPDGIILPIGARFTAPVNLPGRMAANAYAQVSRPLKGKKLRMGISGSAGFSKNPQILNGINQVARSINYGLSLSLNSNFNDKLDMSLRMAPNYSIVKNSNQEQGDRSFSTLSNSFRATWKFIEGFSATTSISNIVQGEVEGIAGTSQWLWNFSLSKKMLKKKLDFRISATDILRQNALINRNITAEYIQNSETNVLVQIVRFSLAYKFTKMGGK